MPDDVVNLEGDLWDTMPEEPPSPDDIARAMAEEYCTGEADCVCSECRGPVCENGFTVR